jgi:hypothetical protein
MATLTLNKSCPPLSGTFNSIQPGAVVVGGPSTPHVVLTTTTLVSGGTLVSNPTSALYADPVTATTARVPLQDIQSLV